MKKQPRGTSNGNGHVRREIGLFTATSIVIANIIGAGIFTTIGVISGFLPGSGWVLACWVFGGLIASGWHTCSLFMRLFVDHYMAGPASLGSPGVDELRWLKPVRPGDALTLRITVQKVKPSRSKPDRGLLFSFCEMRNQEGQVVATMVALNFLRYRERR